MRGVLNEELHAGSTINTSGHRPSNRCLGFSSPQDPERILTIDLSSPAIIQLETHKESFVLLIHCGKTRSCENFVVVGAYIESECVSIQTW